MHPVAQVFARSARIEGHHRHRTGHRLQGDVAEGLAAAGEQEQVATGEVAGQVGTAAHPAEHEVRVVALQGHSRGPVADPDHARVRLLDLQLAKGAHGQVQVLFRGDPADMDRHQGTRAGSPAGAQPVFAQLRREQAGIHRPRQPDDVPEAGRLQLLSQFGGRHHGGVGAVVEAAHPRQRRTLQPGHAVVAHVAVEAGVEAGGDGNAQACGRTQRRPAQRAFGGDVDRIRWCLAPVPGQGCGGWQAEAQARIARQRGARQQQGRQRAFVAVLAAVGRLARTHHFHRMAAAGQAARQSLHGQGHAVDLRRPGFGDEGVAHARQLRVLPSLCVRDASAMTPA